MRNAEFDVCEMPLVTYLVARAAGRPLNALPVFLVRVLPQFLMYVNRNVVSKASDLEGQRVGVRAYTVTAGVWGRIVLRADHEVDPGTITWVAADDEHVLEYQPPTNTDVVKGANLGEMLDAGELAAVIGVGLDLTPLRNVEPLFPQPAEAALSWLGRGLPYPLNHTVVMRSDLLGRHPDLAPALYEALGEAKRISANDPPETIATSSGTREDERAFALEQVEAHPLQYGLEPNRKTLEFLLDHAVDQKLLVGRPVVDEFFSGM